MFLKYLGYSNSRNPINNSPLVVFIFIYSISVTLCIPQQIFIPGLSISNNQPFHQPQPIPAQPKPQPQAQPQIQQQNAAPAPVAEPKLQDYSGFPYHLKENHLNLYNLFNKNMKLESNTNFNNGFNNKNDAGFTNNDIASPNSNGKKIIPQPELLQQHNNDIERYFNEAASSLSSFASSAASSASSSASSSSSSSSVSFTLPPETTPSPTPSTTDSTTINNKEYDMYSSTNYPYTHTYPIDNGNFKINDRNVFASEKHIMSPFVAMPNNMLNVNELYNQKTYDNMNGRISYNNNNNNNLFNVPLGNHELAYNDCSDNRDSRSVDSLYCNLYHMCSNGVYQALLCTEGYLFSSITLKCEKKSQVDCGKRISLEFDRSNMPSMEYMNDYYNSAPSPRIVNGSLECSLGVDGYFADPEFCNIYHHCLAGVDYAEQCPHQLVWNDKKKMCDWQTSVNCTGRVIPVAQGQTSFCTDKADNKYVDAIYCNVFHHCVGGIDNVVRCDEELQWNDREKKCDWESKVKCMGKMLPSEKHYNSTFCIGKSDGPYAHEEYCNVYHVCESGTDNIRQCPNQLFWDFKTKRCDWSGNVECTGRTLITLSTDTTLFCMERRDGVYGDPNWCNVYHNCLSGVDFKTKCPVGLIWNETKKDCDWSDSTQCSTGNFLRDSTDLDKKTFCSDKPNGKYAHEMHCNRYYVCQNGKDIIFTCQNNLRYNATKQECDWAVNVNCFGKQDYMWEGIKENFCKNKPDGNYPDPVYCNIFHQCQAATDYPKRCSNRLMFHEGKGECDWEDQVDCRGKEKLIETSGLVDESKPENNGDGKGRVTKFCMTKENGNYADLYYCNVYHNCHGGFDTVQYCANGLVWRQDTNVAGTCDWPLSSKIVNGVDCAMKKIFLIDKQSQVDIMATLRSDFCITRGEGLFAHTKYCDLYIHCTAQAVAITMECSPGLIFNEKKRECDYLSDDMLNFSNSSYCPPPKQILRPKPKADGTLMFNGNDVTGKFPTKFTCEQKGQQLMYNDDDWCNIYHVCAGPRDNIFICPPGTVFSKTKQGCFDRYSANTCSGNVNYYKPNLKKSPQQNNFMPPNNYELYYQQK